MIVEYFNAHFAAIPPQDFVEKVLVRGLQLKWLMVGSDSCYGAKRAGNLETLLAAGERHGFAVKVLPTITNEGSASPPPRYVPHWPRPTSRKSPACLAMRS